MKVFEILGKQIKKGDVGIEIEVEGEGLVHDSTPKYWKYTEDGSLRGESAEYVLKKPIAIVDVPTAMEEINLHLVDSKLEFSFRTSVHVHVNCLELEYDELLAYMYGYLLLEEPLMTYCGRERKGNRFCLRLQDAEGLLLQLESLFLYGKDALHGIPPDQNRYAAMNIDALGKFGSLEFRGMKGTVDTETVVTWAVALINLREYCKKLGSPQAVYDEFLKLGAAGFIGAALGEVVTAFRYPRFVSDIQKSFSISLDLPHAYRRRVVKPDVKALAKKKPRLDDVWIQVNNPAFFRQDADLAEFAEPAGIDDIQEPL